VEREFEPVLTVIRSRVVPSGEEREATARTAEYVRGRIQRCLEEEGAQAVVEVGGSVAKDTWLRDEVEIDFFMLFPENVDRETLRRTGLSVAHKALAGYRSRERFAEHPYLEAWVDGTRVNIVPCFNVAEKRWKSAADRSPYHTRYIRERLGEGSLADEVRLLKRFLKGVGVYGSEIRVGGFSGYLCELLTIGYGSFIGCLRAFGSWRFGQVLDVEGHYQGRLDEVKRLFQAPLIVVDPVDRNRNVAAAVTKKRMSELIAASRLFLKRPAEEFFYPERRPVDINPLRRKLSSGEFNVITIMFQTEGRVPDILWGELHKTEKALANLLSMNGFTVLRSEAWSDEAGLSAVVLVLESRNIPPVRRHLGPPGDSAEATAFLGKYERDAALAPWVEGGRWVVGVRRRYTDAVALLRERLAGGGRGTGVSTELAEALKGSRILVGVEALDAFASEEFRGFLWALLVGGPTWCAYSSSFSGSS